MGSEYKFWSIVVVSASLLLGVVAGTDNWWRMRASELAAEMVKAGANPIDAKCAAYNSDKPVCVARAGRN